MHEGRIVLERLDEVGHQRVLEQHGHGARRLQILGEHLALVALGGDDDLAQAALEIGDRGRQAEDRHDLGGDRDVEAGFAREAIGDAAQRADDLAQGAVVHVHHAAPGDAARVDAELIAPVDVIVDHRREQIVRRGDGVEIAGEMEVDVLHRHDLGIAAAGRAALHAEAGPERGLAQADHRLLADAVEAIAKADRGRRLAFAGRRRVDGGDEDEFAVLLLGEAVDVVEADLRLGVAVGNEILFGNAEFLADLHDRLHLGFAGDLDVALDRHGALLGLTLGLGRRGKIAAAMARRRCLPTCSRDLRRSGRPIQTNFGPFSDVRWKSDRRGSSFAIFTGDVMRNFQCPAGRPPMA